MTRRSCALLIGILLAIAPAHADTYSTYTAYTTGNPVVPCQKVELSVQQTTTAGGTTTTLYYKLLECAPGQTVATVVVGEGNAAIPATAFRVQNKSTYSLRLDTPQGSSGRQGLIDLTWRATTTQQSTFSGQWTTRQDNTITRAAQEGFTSTALISGVIAGWTVTGMSGGLSSEVAQ